MRKSNSFLLLLFSTVLFISCSKEEIANSSKDLLGRWEGHKIINYHYLNEDFRESDTTMIIFPDHFNITFKKDKHFSIEENVRWYDSYLGIYHVKGNKLSLLDPEYNYEPDEYTFVLKGKKLFLSLIVVEGNEQFRYKYITEIFLTKQ